jgi:hypothetical protein
MTFLVCCDKMKYEVDRLQIEICNEYGGLGVNGCCGGGCYVLTCLVYCPWCATKVRVVEEESLKGGSA